LSLATGRRDAALEGALTVLLRADRSCLLPASAAGLSWLTERALADGLPVSGIERQPGSGGDAGTEQVLVVPWRDARGEIRLAVVRRREPAFTEIEGARTRGFLMVAAAISPKQGDHADVLLADGTEVALRPATDEDADSIAELHRATPLVAPAVPGVGALGRYPVWVREALAEMAPPQRYVVVAEIDAEIQGVAGYERGPNSRDATFGVLVHPRQAGTALGAAMLRRLANAATAAGIEALTATVGVRRDVRSAAAHASGLDATEGWSRGHRRIRIALQPKPESEQQRVSAPAAGAQLV